MLLFRFCVLLSTQNEEQKRGRAGSEAKRSVQQGEGSEAKRSVQQGEGIEDKRNAQQGQEEGRKVSKPILVRKVMKDMKHV